VWRQNFLNCRSVHLMWPTSSQPFIPYCRSVASKFPHLQLGHLLCQSKEWLFYFDVYPCSFLTKFEFYVNTLHFATSLPRGILQNKSFSSGCSEHQRIFLQPFKQISNSMSTHRVLQLHCWVGFCRRKDFRQIFQNANVRFTKSFIGSLWYGIFIMWIENFKEWNISSWNQII